MPEPIVSNFKALPLVSVVCPCYNHERFVIDCLESIRSQNYPNLEIIISDDCSTDASPRLIREWIKANPSLNVTFIESDQNRGLCRAMNRTAGLAKGKYVAPTNTDDLWEPGKLLGQVSMMESLPEKTAVLYSDAYKIDESGALLPERFIETYRSFERMPEGDIHEDMWKGNFIPVMTTLIRRSIYDKVGWYDESLYYDDWDMWLRISKDFDFAYYPQPTARYRYVPSSMSKSATDKMNLANEIMFTKFLRQGMVPKSVRNKGFNYAVRRIFRERAGAFDAGLNTLNELIARYRSPRLLCAWLLYRLGGEYKHYELPLRVVKRLRAV